MISPEELRLGNYIYDDFNEIHRVERIDSKKFNDWDKYGPALVFFSKINGDDGIYQCDVVSPIPLTDVWLLKCGYEFNNETFGYVSKNHMIVISLNDDELIFMPFCTNDEDCYLRIRYVHQLQNILFDVVANASGNDPYGINGNDRLIYEERQNVAKKLATDDLLKSYESIKGLHDKKDYSTLYQHYFQDGLPLIGSFKVDSKADMKALKASFHSSLIMDTLDEISTHDHLYNVAKINVLKTLNNDN